MKNPQSFQATLKEKKELAPLVHLIKFNLNKPIHFEAGQYITLKIPSGEEVFDRPFSIASPPSQKDSFELLVKLIPGGLASTFFENAKVGDSIKVTGPGGTFHIQETNHPIRLIASGTGIAPFRAMLHDLLKKQSPSLPITLTFITSPQEGNFLKEELETLSAEHKNFSYHVAEDTASCVSRLAPKDEHFYLCGGQHFVQDMNSFLLKKEVDISRIYFEKFA